MLLLLLLTLQNGTDFNNAKGLHSTVLLNSVNADSFLVSMCVLSDKGLVMQFLEDEVHFYEFQSKKMRLLAKKGPGPGEIKGGIGKIQVFADKIYITSLDGHIYAYNERKFESLVFNPYVNNKIFVNPYEWIQTSSSTAIASLGDVFYSIEEKKEILDSLVFLTKADGTWQVQETFERETFLDGKTRKTESFRGTYLQFRHLIPLGDDGSFYRVPCYFGKTIEVRNARGELVREFENPHPNAKSVPHKENILDTYLSGNDLYFPTTMLASPSSDKWGNLHVLIPFLRFRPRGGNVEPPLENRFHLYIAKMSKKGDVLNIFRSDVPLNSVQTSFDGKLYYGYTKDDTIVELAENRL